MAPNRSRLAGAGALQEGKEGNGHILMFQCLLSDVSDILVDSLSRLRRLAGVEPSGLHQTHHSREADEKPFTTWF